MLSIFENDKIYKLPSKEFSDKDDLLESSFISGNIDATVAVYFKSDKNSLDEKKHEFLTKMLQAVKVDIKDVLLLNSKAGLSLINLSKVIDIKTIFLFNIESSEVGVQKQIELYKINAFNDFKYIFGEDLSIIESNVNCKKAIWGVLKTIFEV